MLGLVDQLLVVVESGVDRLAGATVVPFFFVYPRTLVLLDFDPVPGPTEDEREDPDFPAIDNGVNSSVRAAKTPTNSIFLFIARAQISVI